MIDQEVFNASKVTMITTTFYRTWENRPLQWHPQDPVTPEIVDKVRGDLAVETITAASEAGVQVIVIDGAQNRPFKDALEREGVLVFDETQRGISASRQQGFRIAHETPGNSAYLWTEPEKVSIPNNCLEPIMKPILDNQADIVIPCRDEASFSTYPDYQADSERESNRLWNDLLKAEKLLPPGHSGFDVWFGPRGWNTGSMEIFLRQYRSTDPSSLWVKPEEYCNALFLPVVAALQEGKRVKSVNVPYRHPDLQTAIERYSLDFRIKRAYQQASILETTKQYLAGRKGQPSLLQRWL